MGLFDFFKDKRAVVSNDASAQNFLHDAFSNASGIDDRKSAGGYEKSYAHYTSRQLYRNDPWASRIVNIPATDIFRPRRNWVIDKEDSFSIVSRIEAIEEDLDLWRKLEEADKLSRIDGGCAIFIATRNKEVSKPFRRGEDIIALNVIPKTSLSIMDFHRNIASTDFGQPTMVMVNSDQASVEVHPSRLMFVKGQFSPDRSGDIRSEYSPIFNGYEHEEFWGMSSIEAIKPTLEAYHDTVVSSSLAVKEAFIDAVGVKGLNEIVSEGSKSKIDGIRSRALALSYLKSKMNMILFDSDREKIDRMGINLNGYPDMLQQIKMDLVALSGIPATKFLGEPPKGLNATGEHDTRNYYDSLSSRLNGVYRPILKQVDQYLKDKSGAGDDSYYEWGSYYKPTLEDAASVVKTYSGAATELVKSGIISQDAAKAALKSKFSNDETWGEFEAAIEQDDDDDAEALIEAGRQAGREEALEAMERVQGYE